jgi:uncharacterized membrane protein YdbT with pleckstrin-like domain
MSVPALQPGEELLAEVKLSSWLVFRSFGRLIGAILTLGLSVYFARASNRLTITNRRLVLRRGILEKKLIEMELGRVAQVEVFSGVFDRLFGIGGVKVIALDQFNFTLYPVAGAERAKDLLMAAVAEARRDLASRGQTPAQPASQSKDEILAALERLGALRDRGVISAAEFEEKKREMLARL